MRLASTAAAAADGLCEGARRSQRDEQKEPAIVDTLEEIRRKPRPAAPHGRLHVAIFAGGVAGALARAGLETWLPADGRSWPWATFAANVAGTLLLGYFATRLQERLPPSTFPRPLLGTGFCGALTTFSAFQIELIRLARHGQLALAAGYLAGSAAAGLVGVYLATAYVRRVRVR